jgi:hypothetical protein
MASKGSNLGRRINANTTRLPATLVQELQDRGDLKQNFSKQKRQKPQKRPQPPPAADEADEEVVYERPSKKRKLEAQETPLQRMLNKQSKPGKGAAIAPESQESKEIAWLEAQLGVGGSSKASARKELAEDGLDDLFGDLERIEGKLSLSGSADVFSKAEESESGEEDELDVGRSP